jgi:hypothetical protein
VFDEIIGHLKKEKRPLTLHFVGSAQKAEEPRVGGDATLLSNPPHGIAASNPFATFAAYPPLKRKRVEVQMDKVRPRLQPAADGAGSDAGAVMRNRRRRPHGRRECPHRASPYGI